MSFPFVILQSRPEEDFEAASSKASGTLVFLMGLFTVDLPILDLLSQITGAPKT